jgi:KaiC/GvpD/RAD55 family RecA-like ATPase
LVSGPRFKQKGQLARRALVANIHGGRAGVLVATTKGAADERELAASFEPGLADMKTPLWIVDAVTRLFGGDEKDALCQYVDGPRDLNGIAAAVQKCLAASPSVRTPVMVIDSVSTIIAYGDPQAAFRFLQVLLGRARRAGTTVILLMDDDMHDPRDVALVRHLADGAIETRAGDGHMQMRILGMGARTDLGWIDYRASGADAFDLTGSFAAGRIR